MKQKKEEIDKNYQNVASKDLSLNFGNINYMSPPLSNTQPFVNQDW